MFWHVDGSLKVRKLSVGSYANNVYLLVCPETSESVLVDAAAEPERIIAASKGTRVNYILLTHGHPDHIGALEVLRSSFNAPVAIHRQDSPWLHRQPDLLLEDETSISFGRQTLRVIHTPGHTPGGVCFYNEPLLFSGDTLFPGGPGATAHDQGDFPKIIWSIRDKLFVLPDSTFVFPGHGLDTTLGVEKPDLGQWMARGW